MKICHVIYIPRLSGAEILVRDLTCCHISLGHQVSIISIDPPETSFVSELERLQSVGALLKFPKSKLGKFARFRFLSTKFKELNPDIVVAHSVIPSAYARLALKLIGLGHIPTVTVLHDASQNDYASKYLRLLEKLLVPSPSCVIAIAETAASNYERHIGKHIKTEVIPNGININNFINPVFPRNQVRENVFYTKDNEVIFLQIGRFGLIKQQHLSVQAFIKVCQNLNFCGKLFLVGILEDTDYVQKLRKVIANCKLENRIIFLGPRTDIPDLLAGADVFFMPSLEEAQGIAFVEALASGITIIASDIPPFQYGLKFPGVSLIQPENIDLFAEKISKAVESEFAKRWERDLSAYSIEKTSNAYLENFNFLITLNTKKNGNI